MQNLEGELRAVKSEAFQRIEAYFEEFCRGLARCLGEEPFDRADLFDIYARLSRLRDRFTEEKERRNFHPAELAALSKVFEDDRFIEGMMNMRQVAEHVRKRGEKFDIWTKDNAPISLNPDSSAMESFSAYRVTLTTMTGNQFHLDHLKRLEEAKRRIAAAMRTAAQ